MNSNYVDKHAKRNANMSQTSVTASKIEDIDIIDYLKNHPDFFRQNPAVLTDMSLPHTSGNATSLVEKQVAILRERSIDARHKLGELFNRAKDNDFLFEKTQTLVLKLLKAKSPNELFKIVNTSFHKDFNVEFASILFILAEPKSLPSIIETQKPGIAAVKSSSDAKEHIGSFLQNQRASCGALRESEAIFLFNHNLSDKASLIHSETTSSIPQSAAITVRELTLNSSKNINSKLIVSVGHLDGNHYNQDTGTLFLDYIADILQLLLQRYIEEQRYMEEPRNIKEQRNI